MNMYRNIKMRNSLKVHQGIIPNYIIYAEEKKLWDLIKS